MLRACGFTVLGLFEGKCVCQGGQGTCGRGDLKERQSWPARSVW